MAPCTNSIIIFGTYRNTGGLYYDNLTTVGGCDSILSAYLVVNPVADAGFTGLDTAYCLADGPVTLTGTPAGGTFSGAGSGVDEFDPSAAGVGSHTITYSYTDANGCTDSSSQIVYVNLCISTEKLDFKLVELKKYPVGIYNLQISTVRGVINRQVIVE